MHAPLKAGRAASGQGRAGRQGRRAGKEPRQGGRSSKEAAGGRGLPGPCDPESWALSAQRGGCTERSAQEEGQRKPPDPDRALHQHTEAQGLHPGVPCPHLGQRWEMKAVFKVHPISGPSSESLQTGASRKDSRDQEASEEGERGRHSQAEEEFQKGLLPTKQRDKELRASAEGGGSDLSVTCREGKAEWEGREPAEHRVSVSSPPPKAGRDAQPR